MNLISYHGSAIAEMKKVRADLPAEIDLLEKELLSRKSILTLVERLKAEGREIKEWHILGPAGVYGFYLGPPERGEMLGREDWETMEFPLAADGKIVLHHRLAELWLAPLLAKRYAVEVGGQMIAPIPEDYCESYDKSAALYDAAFEDLKVREIEWNWLFKKLRKWSEVNGRLPKILEWGCGNGQLLRQLIAENLISGGVGIDISEGMLEKARAREAESPSGKLEFLAVDRSQLPVADVSVDLVLSFMSFRYLDWSRVVPELKRVTGNNGVFLMIDMAETEISSEEEKKLYRETKERTDILHREKPEFAKSLRELVEHPQWQEMLKYHPKRLAVEYESFLTSSFPSGQWERLYVCFDHSLFGFSTDLE